MANIIGEAIAAVRAAGYTHAFPLCNVAALNAALDRTTAALLDAIDGGDLDPQPERVATLAAQLRALRMLDARARDIAARRQRDEGTGAALDVYLDEVLRERGERL